MKGRPRAGDWRSVEWAQGQRVAPEVAGSPMAHASRASGNSGQSASRQPSVAGVSFDRQSWWTARLQSQHQMPPMMTVSLSRSTTTTARAEPQPQHISRNR